MIKKPGSTGWPYPLQKHNILGQLLEVCSHSKEMKQKSEVYVLDVLMKNEACHVDMLEIMAAYQGYLGEDFSSDSYQGVTS